MSSRSSNRSAASTPSPPSRRPPPKPPKKKQKKSLPQCVCNWDDLCVEAHKIFPECAPDNDPWKAPSICFRALENAKTRASRLAALKQFDLKPHNKRFQIHRHHFSQSLVKSSAKHITTPLDRAAALELDKADIHFGTSHATAKFPMQSLLKTKDSSLKGLFVRAPLVPKQCLDSEIKRLASPTLALKKTIF